MAAKIDDIVTRYMDLRSQKDRLKKEFDAHTAKIDTAMQRIEQFMLSEMQRQGLKSLPTQAGTAYATQRLSVTAADKEAFLDYIKTHDAWYLLDARPMKTAVETFMDEHGDVPPGLNISRAVVCNIRKG